MRQRCGIAPAQVAGVDTHADQPERGYWGSLTAPERTALWASGSLSTFQAGAALLTKQDTSGDVLIVWSGLTKVVARLGAGRQLVLALRGPGEIVGEMGNIVGGRRSAGVSAVSEVEALRVPGAEFTKFLSNFPHADAVLRRILVDRLYESDRERLAAASMTVGQRLARLLLNLGRRYGVPDANGVTVRLLSQRELAACVGRAQRSVAREMGQWRDRGIISTTKRSITIHQPDALARIAGRGAPPLWAA